MEVSVADPRLRPVVAITRPGLPGPGIDRMAVSADLRIWPDRRPPTPEELGHFVADADGLVCQTGDRIDAAFLACAPRLRVLSNTGVGFDNLDIAALTARGIPAGNTPGVLSETTADLAFALILAAARRMGEAERLVRSGGWVRSEFDLLLGQDVWGQTLGIVGYGEIGAAVARRAGGFGMRVIYHSRHRVDTAQASWVPLDELLSSADFVSLHTPLTAETRGLIGDRELALMKPSSVLVNTSRGPVVDQVALAAALSRGQIFAAGLDVTVVEPTPLDDPILRAPNCIVLPHIGSASFRTRARMVGLAVDNVLAGLRGERLPACVNPEAYGS